MRLDLCLVPDAESAPGTASVQADRTQTYPLTVFDSEIKAATLRNLDHSFLSPPVSSFFLGDTRCDSTRASLSDRICSHISDFISDFKARASRENERKTVKIGAGSVQLYHGTCTERTV